MVRTMPPRSRTASKQIDSLGGNQVPQPSPASGNTIIRGRRRDRGGRRGRGRGSGQARQ